MVSSDLLSAKLVSAEEAVRMLRPGQLVFMAETYGENLVIVDAMMQDRERLRGLNIIGGNMMPNCRYVTQDLQRFWHVISLFVTSDTKKGVQCGGIDYYPVRRRDWPRLFELGEALHPDVAIVQCCPPDEKGNCNLGTVVGYTQAGALNAKLVIAEFNTNMPYVYGDNFIPASRINYFVQSSRPLVAHEDPTIREEERKIGQYVAELIPDGATVEMGIGPMPTAVMQALRDKKDIGVHSGMITSVVMDLTEQGVITNKLKTIDQGKTVTGIIVGSERFYRWCNKNSSLENHPVGYTHAPEVLAKIDNFVALNSPVEMDLSGQVNGESAEHVQIGGVGGLPDFVDGAALSKGGISIMAMNSTAKGNVSRIRSQFAPGTIVTVGRHSVDYVVTEYGVAQIRGKSLKHRAEALMKIAHPMFREQLLREYRLQHC